MVKYNKQEYSKLKEKLKTAIGNLADTNFSTFYPVICLTGFVSHIHPSFFYFCDKIRQDYNLDRILIYIHTWDIEYNNDDLQRIKTHVKKFPELEFKVFQDRFDQGGFKLVLDSLPFIDPSRGDDIRWVSKFFALHRLSNIIYKEVGDCAIIKVTNRIEFNTQFHSFIDFIKPNNNLWQYNKANSQFNKSNMFLFSNHHFNYINEQQFFSSSLLLLNIFGESLPIFIDRLNNVLLLFQKEYNKKGTDFQHLITNRQFPEGGEVFYRLINMYNPFLYIHEYPHYNFSKQLGRGDKKILSYYVSINKTGKQVIYQPKVTETNSKDLPFI